MVCEPVALYFTVLPECNVPSVGTVVLLSTRVLLKDNAAGTSMVPVKEKPDGIVNVTAAALA